MNTVSKLLLTAALAVSFAAPVLAQEDQTLEERNVYLFMNGKMVHMKASDNAHLIIMKNFKPIKPGTMIYRSGGKFYMSEDRKIEGGKMLSAMIGFVDIAKGDIY